MEEERRGWIDGCGHDWRVGPQRGREGGTILQEAMKRKRSSETVGWCRCRRSAAAPRAHPPDAGWPLSLRI